MKEKKKRCIFCEREQDDIKHYVEDCEIVKEWFNNLGKNKRERIKSNYDDKLGKKGSVLVKLWKEKEKRFREKKKKKVEKKTEINSSQGREKEEKRAIS